MKLSFLHGETDNQPKVQEGTWEDLVQLLTTHIRTDDKLGMPAWSPATFVPPIRKSENARSLCVAPFDIDHVPPEDFAQVIDRVDKSGYAAVMHSTFSHTPEAPSARLIFKLSRPALSGEWPAVWSGIQRMFGMAPATDQKVKDPSRLYFLPCAKPDAPIFAGTTEGKESIDVDLLLSYAQKARFEAQQDAGPQESYAVAPASGAPVTSEGAINMAAIRERVKHINTTDEAKVWSQRVLKGECLESVGGRDNALHKVTGAIVFSLPNDVPTSAILELMRPSLALMDPPEVGTWAAIAESNIERARVRKRVRDDAAAIYQADVMRRLMRESARTAPADLAPATLEEQEAEEFAVVDKYTTEQLAVWAAEQGCGDLIEFERRWIIQEASAYYVFVEGRYLPPIGEKIIETSFQRDLARAPITIRKTTKDGGEVWRSASEILRDFSTPARSTKASLSLQQSYYDPQTQTFHEAVCPLRCLRPTNHPEIQRWIDLVGGEKADLLTDWISAVSRLDRQTAALYLDGPAGVGKTLMASGLARLWTEGGPSELANILGGFNDSLTRCPLVFADEALPQRKGITAELRRVIGSTSRNLSRKFMPNCSLDGALRVIVAGNNDQLLTTGEEHSVNDIYAFAGRFLKIEAPKAAADYLESLGGPAVVGEWIKQNKLAAHSLYLRGVRTVNEAGRFLVSDRGDDFQGQLASSSGFAGPCLEFLTHYLIDPMTLTRPSNLVLIGEGEILVNTEALAKDTSWDSRVPSVSVPSAASIGRALGGLSSGSIKADTHTYFRLKTDLILSYMTRLHLGDVEAVRKRIAAPNAVIAAALTASQST